jgi:uncharacterized protein YwgA
MGDKSRLFTVFDALGCITLQTLQDRKIFQKRLYFLEQFGMDLGYDFNFYMYGPYSSSATRDAFDLQEQRNIAPETLEHVILTREECIVINSLNNFIRSIPGDEAHMLELLSSIHYLSHLSYLQNTPRNEIEKLLRQMKPNFEFTHEEVETAWILLRRFNLI